MKLMFDVQALQTDMTRITSLETGRDTCSTECSRTQPFIPRRTTAAAKDDAWSSTISRVPRRPDQRIPRRMKNTMDGDASLLDKTLTGDRRWRDPNVHEIAAAVRW